MKLTCHTPAQTQDSEVTVGSGRYRTKLASRHESKCPPDAVLSCQMELPRGASRSGHTRGGLGSVTIRHQPLGESLALREQKESTEGCPWGNGLNLLRRRSPERAHTVIVVPERLGFRPTPARAATCRPSLRGHGSADGLREGEARWASTRHQSSVPPPQRDGLGGPRGSLRVR